MASEWIISTVVGTGEAGYSGDGGPADRARLNNPFDLAFDASGNLIFADTYNHCLRRVDARTQVITTLAGTGTAGFAGDGGPAVAAQLNQPYGVKVDRAGNVYTADRLNARVRRIDGATGVITTLAGGDGAMAEPNGLALDPGETQLFIADVAGHRVHVVTLATGAVSVFAGSGVGEHSGDGGAPLAAGLFGARAVAVTADGAVYILERQGSTLRRVRAGRIETVAGTGVRASSGDGGPAIEAAFNAPKEMVLDQAGNILLVDTETHVIRRIDGVSWVVSTIAGTGAAGGGGDGGPAIKAGLARPHGAVFGPDGAIYIGDSENHRIRKLTPV